MGVYLNPRNNFFLETVNKEIYVDKSLLIEKIEYLREKVNKYICVSRPRRFGKSTDANMLVSYYCKAYDASHIFDGLKIAQTDLYRKHLNQHNVIYLNMQNFLSRTKDMSAFIDYLTESVLDELLEVYEIRVGRYVFLADVLERIYAKYNETFIFVVDEWDCIFREYKDDKESQRAYLDFLRDLFKDKPYVELAYMTGILPIKKYGTHSALNMFEEISMVDPGLIPEFMGFSEEEVKDLCLKYDVDFSEMKQWYDGYQLTDTVSTFSPRSVVASITRKKFGNYWANTETYEALQIYIDMNYDGLKDNVIRLLAGEHISLQTTSFQNDMTTFKTRDDVLTLLIHLGYLGYNSSEKTCYIPNREVIDSFENSIKASDWQETTKALLNSQALLEATWAGDEESVAGYIEEAHLDTSILTYNNENALSYTISIAYLAARNHYTIVREMPGGKGFADMVFIPIKDKPAMLVELKWDQDADTAITQIREKKYPKALEKYKENLMLVAISYDKKTKKHMCKIEH